MGRGPFEAVLVELVGDRVTGSVVSVELVVERVVPDEPEVPDEPLDDEMVTVGVELELVVASCGVDTTGVLPVRAATAIGRGGLSKVEPL